MDGAVGPVCILVLKRDLRGHSSYTLYTWGAMESLTGAETPFLGEYPTIPVSYRYSWLGNMIVVFDGHFKGLT